jgi:hypothetical protein
MYMGQASSSQKCTFQELQKKKGDFILINTLPLNQQHYLIKGTLPAIEESQKVNDLLYNNKKIEIIIYGLDSQDISPAKKFAQLKTLGFENVSVYIGGLFEWALLQEVYGSNFPTEGTLTDPLDLYKKIDGER